MAKISDNTGSSWGAKVSKKGRLYINGSVETKENAATDIGNSYNINSGLVNLTSANASGVLYIKNNELQPLRVEFIEIMIGNTTGGTATSDTDIKIIKNPTTGTLVSAATDADTVSNRNFGSSNTLDADVYKGVEGSTVTNGSTHIRAIVSPGDRTIFPIDEKLPKGDSLAVTIEPNTSNTNMDVMAAVICYLEDPDL